MIRKLCKSATISYTNLCSTMSPMKDRIWRCKFPNTRENINASKLANIKRNLIKENYWCRENVKTELNNEFENITSKNAGNVRKEVDILNYDKTERLSKIY